MVSTLDIPKEEHHLWDLYPLQIVEVEKIWVSKCIGTFIAGYIARKYPETVEEEFLKSSSFIISNSGSFIENKFLRGVYLPKIGLTDVNLSMINFSGADLSGANLQNANLKCAYLGWYVNDIKKPHEGKMPI